MQSEERLNSNQRKIIHVDMDCFYAAIEIRDNQSLENKPVAVGGDALKRGVICTCNYIARQYGVHSAMPTATAYRLCPNLIVLPVNMAKYVAVSNNIKHVFQEITEKVEPLSLDEAYLDVTGSSYYHGSATLIAKAIRKQIWETEKLTASAGVAPNKFLAKIASAWQKPNGLFVITPDQVKTFVKSLPVTKLFGIGKVTATKLNKLGITTCLDLQKTPLSTLNQQFGKLGNQMYYQSRGIDNRPVETNRLRKSLSVETTFEQDLVETEHLYEIINDLFHRLLYRLQESATHLLIKNQFIKIKFNDFTLMTAEIKSQRINIPQYKSLFQRIHIIKNQPIRLLGLGVHFDYATQAALSNQLSLFKES